MILLWQSNCKLLKNSLQIIPQTKSRRKIVEYNFFLSVFHLKTRTIYQNKIYPIQKLVWKETKRPHIRGLKSHDIDSASFLNPRGRKSKAGVISQILSSHTESQFSDVCPSWCGLSTCLANQFPLSEQVISHEGERSIDQCICATQKLWSSWP